MNTLYDIINILPFSLLAFIIFGSNTGMPEGSAGGFILCLALSVFVISLRSMKRKNRLRSMGIAAVFVIGVMIAVGEENRLLFLKEYPWVIHIIFLSAAALFAGILAAGNIWIRRAAAAALLIYCAAGLVLSFEISKEAFALICLILLVRLSEEIQLSWMKSGCSDIKEHITSLSPILLAVCIAVYLIPAPAEPYDWKFAKDIYSSASALLNRLYGYITHPDDDYGVTGFSDSGSFLAGLHDNDEEVLFITSGNTTIRSCRLIGCISGDFTGREWVFDAETETNYRMTDSAETLCAVRKYAGAAQSGLLQKTNLYCENYMYNTKYIFAPAKMRFQATKEKLPGISEKNGSIISQNRLGYNDSYLVSCYVLNYSSPELPELLTSAEPLSEADWEQTAKAENILGREGCSFEDYLDYRAGIYEKYCRSRSLSEQAKAVADSIKNNSRSRYEAAKKLETYLKNFEYSANAGALPGTVTDAGSFLDHFLFTSKKGWCMHFATAYVLMANEMGIPCRYVQGYTARPDTDGKMIVKQSDAHAWPEVYFDNVGWAAFEPTPGFSVPAGWGRRENTADTEKVRKDADDSSDTGEEAGSTEERTHTELGMMIFIVPAAASAGTMLIFFIVSRFVSRRKYRCMTPHDKFIYLTRRNFRLLGMLGFTQNEGETLSEYHDRIIRSGRQDINEHLSFITLYETMLYSGRDISAEDIAPTEAAHDALRTLAAKSRLRFRLMLMIRWQ